MSDDGSVDDLLDRLQNPYNAFLVDEVTMDEAAAEIIRLRAERDALQSRVAELEAETKELQARATKLTRLVEILVENDPEDMAADAVTVLDVWRKEAREFLARHARLDARQTGMEKMRENEAAEILAALEGKKDE